MISVDLREQVRQRAKRCCEYCRIPESSLNVTFHVEHIRAKQHLGTDDADNLALACDRCNLHKGPNLTSVDPETDQIAPLFHPRRDDWADHFQQVDGRIAGLTPTGRATARLLQINTPIRVTLRRSLHS